MSKKVITFTLDTKEISRAIKDVKTYKKEFISKTRLFMSQLVDAGVRIASEEVVELGAFDSGRLADSFQSTIMYTDGNGKGIIFTDCPWAAFVEFGTGVVGEQNPHPTMPWDYDTNNHGDAGWVYFTDGSFHWTKGMPSRPFMYHTALELEQSVRQIAKEAFG